MRRTMLPLALLAGLCSAHWAGAQPDARRTLAGDPRLSAPMTVRWQKTTLADALKQISKSTGAQMTPDPGLMDEPVMGVATALPAHRLMGQLATLLHYTWVVTGGTPIAPNYRLIQTRAQKQEEQDEIDRAARAVMAALDRELDRYRTLGRMSPEQLQAEQEKSDRGLAAMLAGGLGNVGGDMKAGQSMIDGMAIRAVGSPIGRAMLSLVDGLSPSQWQELRDDESLVFSSNPRPGEVRLPASLLAQLQAGKPVFPFPKTLFDTFAPQAGEGIAKVEQMMQERWSQADGFKVSVQLSLNLGAQPLGLLRVAPEPLGGAGNKEEMLNPVLGMSGLMVMASPQMQEQPEEDPAERDRRLAADPVLGKKAALKLPPPPERKGLLAVWAGGWRAPEVLPAVVDAFGMPILADAYTRQSLTAFKSPGDGEVPFYKVLDALAGGTRRWELDGGLVRMKSRMWAHDRRAEIPARLIRQWNAVREKQGGFTLENLAEIALTLRDEQLESLMFVAMDGEEGRDIMNFMAVASNRGILRLYGRLLPGQKGRLRAGQPIPVRTMLPAQQALLLTMNKAQNQSMFSMGMGVKPRRTPEQLAGATLALKREGMKTGGAAVPGMEQLGAMELPSAIYTFKMGYPDSQSDQYTLVVVEPRGAGRPAGRAPAPAAPRRPPEVRPGQPGGGP